MLSLGSACIYPCAKRGYLLYWGYMGKQKKKRNKSYSGVDAAATRPTVTRITAVNRNKFSQWWFDHKRVARPVLITSAVVAVAAWLLFELIRIAGGS